MHNFHDPYRHLNYLRQSLSQNNESIGFFISAGCPLSVKMPDDKWPLIPDVAKLTQYIQLQLKQDKNFQNLLIEIKKAGKNPNNIEDILSFLRSLFLVAKGGKVRGFNENDLSKLENLICAEIVKKLDVSLPSEETPYHRLCNWVRSLERKCPIELFTTNYDLLLEQALEDLEIPYFDGFVGSIYPFFDLLGVEENLIPKHWSRLWKIHGSINWYQDNTNGQSRVYRTSDIKKDKSHLIYPSHLKYEESRKMPYLALIDQLSRFIRRKSSLLILSGYSFNDYHLNDTIHNALKSNPTGMILALMHGNYNIDEDTERYPNAYYLAKKQHNLNIWTFDKAIIGTNIGEWKPSKVDIDYEDIKDFVDLSLSVDEPPQYFVKLGDFDVFTKFLKRIIGTKESAK